MKTLYININNELIQSNEELEVLNYDLDSDFFFYLGEKIAKDCKVENENALITAFNTKDNEEDYKQIIAQWNELKNILFSEECEGKIELTLPNGYIHWLRYSEKYNHVYDKNFSHGEPTVIKIDLEELHEDSVEDLQRKILRKLQRDNLYLEIDEIVFNDDAINRKSPIVRTVKDKYDGIGFKVYKEWLEDQKKRPEDKPTLPTSKSYRIIKALDYDFNPVSKPSNGYCCIEKDGKYGVIDANGVEVIQCKFDYIRDYSEGVFATCLDDKWGYIDIQSNVVIPFIYDDLGPFIDGLAYACRDEHRMIIDKYGRSTFDFECESLYNVPGYFIAEKDGFYIIMEESGRIISKISQNKYRFLIHQQNGYFRVTSVSTGLEGMINSSGKEIISCKYQGLRLISDNILSARYNNKWGFIDIKDNVLYPFKNQQDSFIHNGKMYVLMVKENHYNNSDTDVYECNEMLSGKLLRTLYNTSVNWVYMNNLIEAELLGTHKKGLLNEYFEIVLPFEYERIYDMKYQNRFLCKKDGIFQIIEIIQ